MLDESGFSLLSPLTRTWSRRGQTPIVRTSLSYHERLNLLGALCVTAGGLGWYRYSASDPWRVSGYRLDERYGNSMKDSLGQDSFDYRSQMPDTDPYQYPAINGLRIWLEAERDEQYPSLWQLALQTGAGLGRIYEGTSAPGTAFEIEDGFRRSSYPGELGGGEALYVSDQSGPDKNGGNTLPAMQVRLKTRWIVTYRAEWDVYGVNTSNEYVVVGRGSAASEREVRYFSHRSWDPRQSFSAAESGDAVKYAYCNAMDGFVPVPVLEGQSVLVP